MRPGTVGALEMELNASISLEEITFRYRRRLILDHVSLTIAAGRSLAITGRSGSGKSTLSAIASALVRPQGGRVIVAGTDVSSIRSNRLAEFRRANVGIVFQGAELIPTMTALENVAFPMMLAGATWEGASARAKGLLDSLDVAQADASAWTLSGGEAQRVGIARALANSPALIVADEPTASLDGETKELVAGLLFEQSRSTDAALLVVTHDLEIARRADEVLRLAEGVLEPDRARVS